MQQYGLLLRLGIGLRLRLGLALGVGLRLGLGLGLGSGLGLGFELGLWLHHENMEVGRIFQVRQIFHDTGFAARKVTAVICGDLAFLPYNYNAGTGSPVSGGR